MPSEKPGKTTRKRSYDDSAIKMALAACENGMTVAEAAKKFGIPQGTLWGCAKRIYGEKASDFRAHAKTEPLTKKEDLELKETIRDLYEKNLCVNKTQIFEEAKSILDSHGHVNKSLKNKSLGKAWVQGFLSRHKDIHDMIKDSIEKPSAKNAKEKQECPDSNTKRLVPANQLTGDEEAGLLYWMRDCKVNLIQLEKLQVFQAVKEILDLSGRKVDYFTDNLPGEEWWSDFISRHADVDLKLTPPCSEDSSDPIIPSSLEKKNFKKVRIQSFSSTDKSKDVAIDVNQNRVVDKKRKRKRDRSMTACGDSSVPRKRKKLVFKSGKKSSPGNTQDSPEEDEVIKRNDLVDVSVQQQEPNHSVELEDCKNKIIKLEETISRMKREHDIKINTYERKITELEKDGRSLRKDNRQLQKSVCKMSRLTQVVSQLTTLVTQNESRSVSGMQDSQRSLHSSQSTELSSDNNQSTEVEDSATEMVELWPGAKVDASLHKALMYCKDDANSFTECLIHNVFPASVISQNLFTVNVSSKSMPKLPGVENMIEFIMKHTACKKGKAKSVICGILKAARKNA